MPRFLCDRMLERLGRYLRAAGYDTGIADVGDTDASILRRLRDEQRILLTCDRELAGRASGFASALLLPGGGLEAAARALDAAIGIDWLHAPFSRCLVDNTPVVPAADEDLERLPPRARDIGGAVMLCPECARLYWPGSHVRRMTARLSAWRDETDAAP